MPRKLKVFQARFGFYDAVIAVPSQVAALRAWGTTQNLFAEGQAWVSTDSQAIAAALAQPETLLRRAVGTADPFSLTPRLPRASDLPDVAAAHRSGGKGRRPKAGSEAAVTPPPDRSALDAAEAVLARLDREREEQDQVFASRRAALEAEIEAARAMEGRARSHAERVRAREEAAYRAAGGAADPLS